MRPINSFITGLVAIAAFTGTATVQDPATRRERQVDSFLAEYTRDLTKVSRWRKPFTLRSRGSSSGKAAAHQRCF